MKIVADANLSPRVASALRDAGYDATHVADLDLLNAPDEQIFEHAVAGGYTIVTADTDFSMLLALRRSASPSVVLLRGVAELGRAVHVGLLVANLDVVVADLDQGAIVSLSPTRMAVRALPLDRRDRAEDDSLVARSKPQPSSARRCLTTQPRLLTFSQRSRRS